MPMHPDIPKYGSKIDVVWPAITRDVDRFEVALRLLQDNFEPLGNCFVIVPSEQRSDFARFEPHVTLLDELDVVPELRTYRLVGGWQKQQLIKLAMAERVRSEFYLTMDCDVLCVKPVHFADLIINGKSRYSYTTEGEYGNWGQDAYRVLHLEPVDPYFYEVTPTLLSRDIVLQLVRHIEQYPYSTSNWARSQRLRCLVDRVGGKYKQYRRWLLYLLNSLPWTEYTLYFTFARHSGLLAEKHIVRAGPLYSYENSLWTLDQLTGWKPEAIFGEPESYFLVVQSNSQIPWLQIAEILTGKGLLNLTALEDVRKNSG